MSRPPAATSCEPGGWLLGPTTISIRVFLLSPCATTADEVIKHNSKQINSKRMNFMFLSIQPEIY